MAITSPRGFDSEKQKAVNYFIKNGWPEYMAYELVENFSKKTLNPGEIICLGALMKLMNSAYYMAEDDRTKSPKISVISDYPLFKVAVNDVSPLMGRMMILPEGKIYVEIDITDGDVVKPIDWIEFAETNEQLAAYDKFINSLIDGSSPYLKLADGSSFKLADITYSNLDFYLKNIVEIEGQA